MALGSTQPLVKMSTRNIPGGKDGRCVRLTTSPPSCADCHENLGAQTSRNPLGHTGPIMGLLYLYTYMFWQLILFSNDFQSMRHKHKELPVFIYLRSVLGNKSQVFAKRCFYIAVLTTTFFRRYVGHHQVVHSLIFKANYTIYKVFVNEISWTSIKSALKIITVAVELKIYSEVKDIISIKSWVCDLGRGGGVMVSDWAYSCLATLVFCGVTVVFDCIYRYFWFYLHNGDVSPKSG
jgi:hypothetical protein